MKRKIKYFFISIILFSFLVIKFYSNDIFIQPFGYGVLIVKSGSMLPTIKKWNIIIIKKSDEYEIDDIVTYKNQDKLFITHRIIRKCKNEYITKGDNNNVEDNDILNNSQIFGKVILIV